MVATFVTLCNSACITCIWCFLLSICFPKLVNIMEGTKSNEYWSKNDGAHEIKRQHEKRQEVEFNKKKYVQKERPNVTDISNRRLRDPEDIHQDQFSLYKRPENSQSLDSAYSRKNCNVDSEGQEMFANRMDRCYRHNSADAKKNMYRLCGKFSGVASDLKECILERKKHTAKEFSYDRMDMCPGCGNHQSRRQKNM